jgi:Fic family protein
MDGVFPCELNHSIVGLMMEIAELVGRVEGMALAKPSPKLRHNNRVRTIRGSVGIEGNTCSVAQVEAIAEGRLVPLPERERIEVHNALEAYAALQEYDPHSIDSLLSAHLRLMDEGLMLQPGRFRDTPVEVYITENMTRRMPEADQVPCMVDRLFDYLCESNDAPLLKSVRFHFQFVHIHPFADGNGRAARLWQTRLLMEYHPIFEFLDVESMVFEHRPEYYEVIRRAQDMKDSACFVEFMLTQIKRSLSNLWKSGWAVANTVEDRLRTAHEHFKLETFSRKDYLQLFKSISTVTASRDLKRGVDSGMLVREGNRRTAVYCFHGEGDGV